MLHFDPIMASLRGWKLRKKKVFFCRRGRKGKEGQFAVKETTLVQDAEEEYFWSLPYPVIHFVAVVHCHYPFVFLSSHWAGE